MAFSPFVSVGCSLKIDLENQVVISYGNELLLRGKEFNGLYAMDAKTRRNDSAYFLQCDEGTIAAADQLLLLHRGYGHLGFAKLRQVLVLAKEQRRRSTLSRVCDDKVKRNFIEQVPWQA